MFQDGQIDLLRDESKDININKLCYVGGKSMRNRRRAGNWEYVEGEGRRHQKVSFEQNLRGSEGVSCAKEYARPGSSYSPALRQKHAWRLKEQGASAAGAGRAREVRLER